MNERQVELDKESQVSALFDLTIDHLWIQFQDWVHCTKGYFTADGKYLIKLWYEFLSEARKEDEGEKE